MGRKEADLVTKAYNHILDMIMTKKLMPGERVPEQLIAQEFGISRSPVRDAMRQLANEGLITLYPYRFAQVSACDHSLTHEVGTLRLALDSMAVKLSMLYGSQADFLALRQLATSCRDAYAEGDYEARIRYDCDFHMMLAEISQNPLLVKFQKELYLRVQFLILHHPNIVEFEERHLSQHFELTEKMMAHDEEAAMGIITDHLTSFYSLRDHFPDGFFSSVPLYTNQTSSR